MARGKKPRPTKLQVELYGDTSGRRKNQIEPEAPTGKPTCPAHLGDIARAEWESICDQLESVQLLSPVDGRVLEIYCTTYENWRVCCDDIQKHRAEHAGTGITHLSDNTQSEMSRPIATRMEKLQDQMFKYLVEFGLTPAARARMRINKPAEPNSRTFKYMQHIPNIRNAG